MMGLRFKIVDHFSFSFSFPPRRMWEQELGKLLSGGGGGPLVQVWESEFESSGLTKKGMIGNACNTSVE